MVIMTAIKALVNGKDCPKRCLLSNEVVTKTNLDLKMMIVVET